MPQERIANDSFASSWLMTIEVQAIRFLLFAAVASGIAVFSVSAPKTVQAVEYAWCLSEKGALEAAFNHLASSRRDG
jgi:hypothetical protein